MINILYRFELVEHSVIWGCLGICLAAASIANICLCVYSKKRRYGEWILYAIAAIACCIASVVDITSCFYGNKVEYVLAKIETSKQLIEIQKDYKIKDIMEDDVYLLRRFNNEYPRKDET